jgi:hypothetical protein
VNLCRIAGTLRVIPMVWPPYDRQGFTRLARPQTLRDSCRKPLSENCLRAFKRADLPRRYGRCRWTLGGAMMAPPPVVR